MQNHQVPVRAKTTLFQRAAKIIAALSIAALPLSASAYTECKRMPALTYIGNGILYIRYAEGGVGIIGQSSVDFKPVFAAVLMAIATKQPITVRYTADGVACDSEQQIEGVWVAQ